MLECSQAESMVNRYIDHTLSDEELKEFIEHVRNCPSCYDELETNFIVHSVIELLDTSMEDSPLDFRVLLDKDLKQQSRHLVYERVSNAFWYGILLLWSFLLIFVTLVICQIL